MIGEDCLNPRQLEAARHVDGPLLILAGAGSGKTRVLTYRVASLIADHGIPPFEILAVTFTNKAAEEMRSRVERLAGQSGRYVTVATFHSFCVRVLRNEAELIGYPRSFTIFDESDQLAAVNRALRELNLSKDIYKPSAVLNIISDAKNELLEPAQFAAKDAWQKSIAGIYAKYQKLLVDNGSMDFDDLIMQTVRLFTERPEVLDRYQERYRYIMVDEYQDTNHAQYMLVKLLAGKYRNIAVVGDDDQSIYTWRGADPANILEFEHDYPDAKVIKLEQNYRSTANILEAASGVIANNRGRKKKTLWTQQEGGSKVLLFNAPGDREEAAFVVRELERLVISEGRKLSEFAVLYRMNSQSRLVEEALLKDGMPYRVIGGLKFYERKEVKDVLAYLRFIVNPHDSVALSRILNVPRRGIGETTEERVRAVSEQRGISLWDAAREFGSTDKGAERSRRLVGTFVALGDSLISLKGQLRLGDVIERILEDSGYYRELKADDSLEAEARLDNLRELVSVAREFEARQNAAARAFDEGREQEGAWGEPGERPDPRDIDAFLEEVALLTDLDRTNFAEDSVSLMTLHSAKGLEFNVVFMIGMEENVFPLSRAIYEPKQLEEERRLCYVGMTRAKQKLYLVNAAYRMLYGAPSSNLLSRFVNEIPQGVLECLNPGEMPSWRTPGRNYSSAAWSKGTQEGLGAVGPHYGEVQRRPLTKEDIGSAQGMPEARGGRDPFKSGDKVSHPAFGKGTVVSVSKTAGDTVVTVAFDGQGIKRLALSFAPLSKA
ncbi:MAG TPA: UvrD-helicase domain-containing protein [Bacillota bacterium]|nr:UvrD-helicase domain-containing protein [Bacillota bacterium]HOA15580.1 UvrD-helicase domain-containing protein [Bacillota bacterium]